MNFFRYFPLIQYEYQTPNGIVTYATRNITAHVNVIEKVKQNLSVMYDYVIRDGERPDTVATNVYGSPEYTWVILLLNNVFSLYDWPLTVEQFDAYIKDKYGSIEAAQQQFVYRNASGLVVDSVTYNANPSDRGDVTTQYDEEMRLNEDKRRIKIIPAEFVGPLVIELKKLLA